MAMNRIYIVLSLFLIIIIIFSINSYFFTNKESDKPELYVGVSVAHYNLEEIIEIVDKIQSYTNLFVVGSTGITYDVSKLDPVCTYLYEKGFFFLIYMHPTDNINSLEVQRQWVEKAKKLWGQQFIGLYAFDEPGGRQVDNDQYVVIEEAGDNYTDTAEKYVTELSNILYHITNEPIEAGDLPLFTSDYALYWFDYQAGYDTVFAEFGWNYSRQLNVAFCRGAATVQNKDWGAIMTWTYNHPPYIESGQELYDDLVLAYENGAKYILVFDSNEDYTQGILKEEHLDALKKFSEYSKENPQSNFIEKRVAYVLPKGYAYGFRGPKDKIWGFWEADSLSYEVSMERGGLLEQYGKRLDVIYYDNLNLDETYITYIFWNGTIINP
ncbi:MAG: hypothetical protein P8Y18_01005 [Candidatus Bathyarchaeota archaeon]